MGNFLGNGMMGARGFESVDYGAYSFWHWIMGVGTMVWLIVGVLLVIYLWKLINKN